MEYKRQIAIDILDEFEELLEAKNITIPSQDREGNESEARLYGDNYWALEDYIADKMETIKQDLMQLCDKNEECKNEIKTYFDTEDY